MTLGGSIADTIRSSARGGAVAPAADPGLDEVDDGLGDMEDFAPDGEIEAPAAMIPPVESTLKGGGFPRPNGVIYFPRTIAGVQDVAFMRDCRDHGESVLLYGPPGTGKTALPESAFMIDAQRAEDGTIVHPGFETIICSEGTTEADFYGAFVEDPDTGAFVWVPGPLQRAVERGVPILVDEIFLADSRVLSATLYPLMDGRGMLWIPMNPRLPAIPVSPGFSVVAMGNPDVPGAVFSEALRDRSAHQVEVGTDWSLTRRLRVPQDIITVAKNLDGLRRQRTVSWSPQMRALLGYRDNLARYGQSYALSALLGMTPFEDRPLVAKALDEKFGRVDPSTLSSSTSRRRGV